MVPPRFTLCLGFSLLFSMPIRQFQEDPRQIWDEGALIAACGGFSRTFRSSERTELSQGYALLWKRDAGGVRREV